MDWVSISKNRVVLMLKVRIDFLRMLLKDTDSHQTFFRNKIWIPYDFTFNWSIINKEKSKQNITRDIEIKNNLTTARGEGVGDGGKGFQELL